MKNYQDLGRVVALDDEPEMNYWKGDECNQFRGTDSTIFPPYMNAKEGVWAYEKSICRSIEAHFVGPNEYMDIDVLEFAVDFGSPHNTKDCYCRGPGKCPKNGNFMKYNKHFHKKTL